MYTGNFRKRETEKEASEKLQRKKNVEELTKNNAFSSRCRA